MVQLTVLGNKHLHVAGHQEGVVMEQTLPDYLSTLLPSTPHVTTGVPPCVLMIGCFLCTRLHLIQPDVGRRVRDQQDRQKTQHYTHS